MQRRTDSSCYFFFSCHSFLYLHKSYLISWQNLFMKHFKVFVLKQSRPKGRPTCRTPRVARWCLSGASKLLLTYSRVLHPHSHRLCSRIHTTAMLRPQKWPWQHCASSLHPKLIIWVLVSCFVCEKERQLDMSSLFLSPQTRDLNLNSSGSVCK